MSPARLKTRRPQMRVALGGPQRGGPPRSPPRALTPSLRSVTPMSSGQVRTSDAYLLFYELASPPSRM